MTACVKDTINDSPWEPRDLWR